MFILQNNVISNRNRKSIHLTLILQNDRLLLRKIEVNLLIAYSFAVENSKAFDILKTDFKKDKFMHAYLVVSPDQEFTKALFVKTMQFILCGKNGCGECSTCKKVEDKNHIDISFVDGENQKIKVEEVKKLVDNSFVKGFESDIKFNVITFAENMTIEAQNKLLKTLEEPTQNVHFLIGVTNQFSLLPTIRSRCKVIESFSLDKNIIARQLEEIGHSKSTSIEAAESSMGNLSYAKMLAEEKSDPVDFVVEIMENLNSSTDVLKASTKVLAQEKLNRTFEYFSVACRDALMKKNGAEKAVSNSSKSKKLAKLTNLSNNCLTKIIDGASKAQMKILANVSPVAVVDEFLFKLAEEKSKCKKF